MVKWQGRQGSSNIEDRSGQSSGGFGGGGLGGGGLGSNPFGRGGGGFRLPSGRSGGSMGSIAVVVIFIIIALAFGVNPLSILTGDTSTTNRTSVFPPTTADQTELKQFVSVMVKDTEDYWTNYFKQQGQSYTPPHVVEYTERTSSGCGTADASAGPFYCPDDQTVYIDLSFYQQLRDQFGAPGDFAQAYVIAHEVGHHVQNVTGILPEFNQKRQSMSQEQSNAYSVRIELQADCFAGVWGKSEFEQGYLDSGDVEEAINAANQIGDDTLTHGQATPRQYTHGTSAQRMKWFKQGYTSGNPDDCDTLNNPI